MSRFFPSVAPAFAPSLAAPRLALAAAVFALALLAGCGSSNPPQRLPQLPVDNLLDTAAQPAFRTADHQSFAKAVMQIPADGGTHTVPVGEYLLARVVEAFPRGAEVDHLRLTAFDVTCKDQGWFSSTLVCSATSDFRFLLYKRAQQVAVRIDDLDMGGLKKIKAATYTVSRAEEGKRDAFGEQVRTVPDAVAARFKRELAPVLLASQRRQAF